MDAKRWEAIESLCAAALELERDHRAAFLKGACAGDPSLREEIESLIAEAERDPSFLERPILESVAPDPDTGDELAGGEPIGPYRLVRPLGSGGMGRVYLAEREAGDIRRSVALKVIRRGMDTEEVLRRFRLERRILAGLSHQNIAMLIDAGATADGRPYFVMEHVDGVPITEYCDERRLPIRERLELFRTVCAAVQHAHQHLVIHRDLKPGNILVTPAGVPKLLDFGIGKVLEANEEFGSAVETRADVRLLTPEYAAPEQITGETITTATDVYALGVLLYVLLTGHHPYGAGLTSRRDIEKRILDTAPSRPSVAVTRVESRAIADGQTEEITPAQVSQRRATNPAQLRRRLAGDLDNIVLMALRKEPARRYASAAALAEDLRRHLAGLPVAARPDTFGYRTRKFVGRNRAAVAAATVAFAALTVTTGVTVAQSRRVARESERVAYERDKALDVRGFLLEMFGATGADQTIGATLTARQLLDRQVAQLATSYTDQPDRRAEMMEVLADGYDRLGLYSDAEPLAREALELRRRHSRPRNPELATSLNLYGWILHELGRSAEAEPLLKEAVELRRAAGPRFREVLARSLNDLGVVYNAVSRYEDAEGVLAEALELRRAVLGENHRAVGITANNLAAAHFYRGRLDEAMRVQEVALRSLEAAVGADHQRTIVALSNLAGFRVALGELQDAERDYRELLERQSRLQGRDHPVAARVIGSLASVVHERGTSSGDDSVLAESEALYREALETLSAKLGASHPQTAQTRARLSGVLLDRGDHRGALREAELAHAALKANSEVGGRAAVVTGSRLALARLRAGDAVEAERVQRHTVESSRRDLGDSHVETGMAEAVLCEILVARGTMAEARRSCASAEAILREASAGQRRRLALTRLRLAQTYGADGDAHRADSVLGTVRAFVETGAVGARERRLYDSLAATYAAGSR